MTIESLKRVMWRVRKRNPDVKRPTNHDLRIAIMHECGTHPQTYRTNRKALINLGWIRSFNSKRFELTDKDLTET